MSEVTGIVGGKWFLRVEWEPRDCWIGVYWTRKPPLSLDVWVCALPTLPIHFGWTAMIPFHPAGHRQDDGREQG